MLKFAMELLKAIKEPEVGVIIISIGAIIVAGMAIYGMTLALKKRS